MSKTVEFVKIEINVFPTSEGWRNRNEMVAEDLSVIFRKNIKVNKSLNKYKCFL